MAKKTIEEQVLGKIKRTRKYHTIYHKDVKLTPEQLEVLKCYDYQELQEMFGASDVEIEHNTLLLTFDY